jgi:hypothetical protein
VTGLVNVRNFPDPTYPGSAQKDTRLKGTSCIGIADFNDMNTILDANAVNGYTAWQSQMVINEYQVSGDVQ